MQALHLMALDPVAETQADSHSYGFRKGRSTADAIRQVQTVLSRKDAAKFVLEGDIKGCFDNIGHNWLLAHVPMDKCLLRKWLKAGYLEQGRPFPTEAGTPQGDIISPTLANWALDGLQQRLESLFKTVREARAAKVHRVRYADDFIITGSSRELLETKLKPAVAEFLVERGLTLSETKTHISHVEKGFDFLGWNVRMHRQRLLVQPSKRKAFLGKVRQVIRNGRAVRQTVLIEMLNPILRGWANYHRSQMVTRTFARCDHEIWNALWRWAVRRHPNKGKWWIKQRYFERVDGRDWSFGDKDTLLLNLGRVRKRKHIKILAEANPYDPAFDEYFSGRLAARMLQTLEDRQKLHWLWRFQDGICPVCDQKITAETGWHMHHVKPRRLGGSDSMSNLVLLHENCHRQVHAKIKLT